jgi:thiol-disulfide isomerase/thioredoxin
VICLRQKSRKAVKKHFSFIAIKLLAIIVAAHGIISCDTSEGPFTTKGDADSRERGLLFPDMGIFKPKWTSGPIEISLKDLKGSEISLSDFRGKIVFLNFWTTWCPSCRSEMASMEELHKRLRGKDFVMVAINLQESASTVKGFFKEHKLTFIALLDSKGEAGARFGIRAIPTTFILDRGGRIMGVAIGDREWDSKEAVAFFEGLIDNVVDPSSNLAGRGH